MTNSFRLGADGIYRCDAFQEFVWQSHGFGTRQASPCVDVTLRQIHSSRVLNASGLRDRDREGDALVTDQLRIGIGVRTADCVPILLLDCRNRAVAAIHAGWRGSASEIAKCTVEKMSRDFETSPADIYAAIGPCIRACCYEVGIEVAQQFASVFPEWDPNARVHKLDLAEANRRQLQAAGVPPAHIFDSCLCTTCDAAQFFSYRREPENPGRMVAAITRLA
jgi:YfiH family protein